MGGFGVLLENKTVVVYGADVAIGGAVATALATEDARVFLAGLKPPELEAVAQEIRRAGGQAETAVVDVLDEAAVTDHANAVAALAGSFDVCVIACTHEHVPQPLIDIRIRDFERSVGRLITAHLVVAKAAARHMVRQGSGVILQLCSADTANARPGQGAIEVAASVVEALCRQWACELRGHGIRVVTPHTGGIAEPADLGRVAASAASGHANTSTSAPIDRRKP